MKGGGLWLTGLAQFDNASGTILSDTGISIATSQALTIGASGWGSVSTDGWMTLAGLNGGVLPSLTVNAGAELVAGDNLTIIAGAVTNAGTLASVNGNLVITSTAGISNSGLVYAGGNWLLLRANGTITNDGGTLLALNNLGICGNSTDDCLAVFGTDRAAALTNKNGGQIEAITGDVLIAADVIENRRDVTVSETETGKTVTDTYTQSCNLWALGCLWGTDFHIETTTTTTEVTAEYSDSGAAPQIVSGGDMFLSGESITNAYGLISARGDLSISAGSVDNVGVVTGSKQAVVVRHYKNEFSVTLGEKFTTTSIEDPVVTFTKTGHQFGTIEAGGAITGTIPGALSNGVLTANQTNFSANSASEPGLSTPTFTLLSIAAAGVSEAAQPGGAGGLTFNAATIANPTLASLGLSDIAGLSNDQLFTVNADPVSGYLIETKPDFIDLNSFLGSEYFTDSLGFDPEGTQLRLGDALVETYLIRNQLYNLTGRNILDPTLSEKAQMKAMYDNAINAYESLDLRPGIALSPDQIALLTDDIIWPEEHLINGVKVLVPHVYLASATIDRFSNGAGAQIAGTRIALNTGNILNQGGSIRAEEDLILFASADIDNLFGEISAGNRLSMAADGDFTSLSGLISGKDVGIQAANINIATALTDIGTGGDRIDIAGRQSTVRASNNLSLSADNDLSIIGTRMVAGNNLALQAGGDITVGALHLDRQYSTTVEDSSFEMSQRQLLASSLTAENGSLSITSARFDEEGQLTGGGNIFLEATALSAGDDISIAAAAGDVMLGAGLETRATSSFSQSSGFLGSSSRTSQTFDANYQSTTLDAGGDVSVYGAGNVISQGTQIAAGGDVAMQAGYGNLVFDSMTDLHVAYEHHDTSILGGFMDFTGTKETVRATAHDGAVTAGGDIALIAGGDLAIEGGSFTAGGAFSTDVGGETWLSASVDTEFTSSVAHNNNALLVTDTTDVGVSQDANFTK
ncbi:MAG: hemagglutinin repeat-containing protein, partial [Maritimibacter sp.]